MDVKVVTAVMCQMHTVIGTMIMFMDMKKRIPICKEVLMLRPGKALPKVRRTSMTKLIQSILMLLLTSWHQLTMSTEAEVFHILINKIQETLATLKETKTHLARRQIKEPLHLIRGHSKERLIQ